MEMVYTYTVNPIWSFLKYVAKGTVHLAECAGYARAAAELTRQGHHEEAKRVMLELAEKKREFE